MPSLDLVRDFDRQPENGAIPARLPDRRVEDCAFALKSLAEFGRGRPHPSQALSHLWR